MAGRIAGITIEIGGNTTKLQSALKGVNGSIRGLKSSLRDVDRLLKFKPTSTELLRQKQQMLRTAIDQTKSKLDTLNDAMDQMKANGVDETSEEYQRLQREIIATEQDLKQLESEYAQVASVAGVQMQVVGDKMQEVGQKISEVGSAITQKVTVPLTALGGAAVAAFVSVDKGMDTIVAKTGASGQALEDMKNIAKELTTEIPTDFETAGAAVGEVNTRFKLTGDELADLSGQFIKFAKLNNTDVSSSIDAVQAAMAAFGLSADQAGAYLDTLNAVGQQTGADVNRLSQDLVTNAASFKALGFSASDAASFLGQLSVNGVDSSQVMVGLKKAFVEATKDGMTMKDKLSELQNTMKNADSDTEAYAAAMELFGNRAGPALASAIREGRLSLEALGTSIQDNVGNIDQTFENTLDPVERFKLTLNQLKLAGAELGSTILSVVTPALQKLSSFIETLKSKFDGLTPKQQEMVVKIGMIAAAIGPAVVVIGKLTSGIGTVISVVGKLTTAFSAASAGIGPLSAAFTAITGPIGVVIAAVGALAASFAYLYKTNEEFRAKVQEIWASIQEIISTALEIIKELISMFVEAVKEFWAEWGDEITAVVTYVWDNIVTKIQTALDIIQGILTAVLAVLQGDWKGAWEAIKGVVMTVWDAIRARIAAVSAAIQSILAAAWGAIQNAASSAWNAVKGVITGAWNGIKLSVQTAANAVKTAVTTAWNAVKSTTTSVWNAIKQAIITPIKAAKDKVKSIMDSIKSIFPLKLGKIFDNIKLPHISVSGGKAPYGIAGKGSLPKFSVTWNRSAYDNPLMFMTPTIIPTANGLQGFGDGRGGELVYGHDNLMRDIREAANPITAEQLYNIVLAALDHADMRVNISGREFARIVREV